MIAFRLRQRLAIPTVLVRAIGVHAALFLLLILVVGCGGQSSTDSPAPESDPKSEPTPEAGPNKQEVALEEGSLRDLVQEQVGDFELQGVEDAKRDLEREGAVEALNARYVGPGGVELGHLLVTTRSPEAADNFRQNFKLLSAPGDDPEEGVVDERAIEASGRRVGTVTVTRGVSTPKEGVTTLVLWNNGNLFALAKIDGKERDVTSEDFYESLPY